MDWKNMLYIALVAVVAVAVANRVPGVAGLINPPAAK